MAKIIDKPPLGVRPAYVAAWQRIRELIEGIRRQYESPDGNSELVKKWAIEIKLQCQIIEVIGKDEGESNNGRSDEN